MVSLQKMFTTKKILVTALGLGASFGCTAHADYVVPDDIVKIEKGIHARQSVAQQIEEHSISKQVINLYHQDIKNMDDRITVIRGPNNCMVLFVNTEGHKKNFIEQIYLDLDEDCLNENK